MPDPNYTSNQQHAWSNFILILGGYLAFCFVLAWYQTGGPLLALKVLMQ